MLLTLGKGVSNRSRTDKPQLKEFEPFYSVPIPSYAAPSSYEASALYESPVIDYDAELYAFNGPPEAQHQQAPVQGLMICERFG